MSEPIKTIKKQITNKKENKRNKPFVFSHRDIIDNNQKVKKCCDG